MTDKKNGIYSYARYFYTKRSFLRGDYILPIMNAEQSLKNIYWLIWRFIKTPFYVIIIISYSCSCYSGEQKDSSKIFNLGEIIVYGNNYFIGAPFQQCIVQRSDLERHQLLDVSRGLNLLPGLTLSSIGPRNESTVYVRGFDLRQVPVFLDGIPEYVPFDGYVDLARFTTYDLSEIMISKGFSSILYGANAMGGAINLISKKPAAPFEYAFSGGIMSGGGRDFSLNIGTKRDLYYLTGSASKLQQNSYPVSQSFVPTLTENGGGRDNSYRRDEKYSFKAGVTPNETDEYAFNYIHQHGEKGNPVYTGNDPRNLARYWQWPLWDKYSEYIISQTLIGEKDTRGNVLVKTRFFHDKFKNTLFAYDDAAYTTQLKRSSFQSYYDDDTWGALLEAKTKFVDLHHVTFAFHWRHDIHRENNFAEPVRTMRDATLSFGIEDAYRIHKLVTVIGGVSHDLRKSLQAQNFSSGTQTISDFPVEDTQAWNIQAGAIFNITPERQLSMSVARKTRLATMKDRYSYRLGSAIPNPGLTPEEAINYDFAYREIVNSIGTYKVSVFYNDIRDVIQQVNNVQGNLYQLQNLGKARYYGTEIEVETNLSPIFNAGANYTFLKRENISNPGVLFLDTPVHKVFIHAGVSPFEMLDFTGSLEYDSDRYSSSDGIDVAGAFALFNIKASLKFYGHIIADAGVQNMFDRNYSLVEGYPEPGRMYFATLRLHN